jgi:iron complex outermembrane receptor protein
MFVGLLLWLWATIAAAAEQRFDIPAGPASTGLNLFARQAGTPLLYLNDDVRTKRTNDVRGVYSSHEALDLLLKGTGITAVLQPNGVLTLRVARDEPAPRSPSEMAHPSASLRSPSAADVGSLDEIVIVTAQFREESLQSTPLAITAVSGAALEQRNLLTDVTAITQAAPNVTLVQSGSNGGKTTRAYIRGVGEGDYNFALEPGVAFYIDDVYLGTAYGTLLDLMDLERVEVLRGPQGTLFGKNAIGGAVRLISRQPKGDDSGYLEATTGSFNRLDLRGAYDVALLPRTLLMRVTAMSKKRDGYVDLIDFACAHPDEVGSGSAPYSITPRVPGRSCKYDEMANDDVSAARVAFRWLPGDSLEWNFSGDYSDDQGKGAADTLLQVIPDVFTNYNNAVSIPQYGIPYDNRFVPSSRLQSYATFENAPFRWEFGNSNRLETWGLQNRINWTVRDALEFTSITAYRRYAGAFSRDSDSSPMSTDSTSEIMTHDQLSQELRLWGTSLDSRLNWTLGAFLFDGESRDAGIITADLFDLRFRIDDPSGVHNRSAFLHSVYHFTPRLNLTTGLRYTAETKDYTFNRLDVPQPAPTPLFGPDGMHSQTSQHYNKTDWRLGLDYAWTDDVMTYLQASTGFRGAGFNPRPALPSQIIPFGTETLTSYEIGVKSELIDRRLRVNAAAFFSEYDDIQLTARIPDLAGFPANVRVNAGEAEIRGFELEVSARLSERLSIDGQAAWTYFRYRDLGLAAGLPGGPTLDTDPVYTPRVRYNLSAHYSVPLARAGVLTLGGGYVWQGRLFTDAANTPLLEVGAYGLLNARLAWSSPNERWSVVAFGTNLTNASYYYGKMFISGNGQVKGIPGRPQEWGLTLRRAL